MKQRPPHDGNSAADEPLLVRGQHLEVRSIDGRLKLDEEFLSEAEDAAPPLDVAPPAPVLVAAVAKMPDGEAVAVAPQSRDVAVVVPALAPVTQPDETLSIAELLESSTPVEWPEAVAIAEQICAAVTQHAHGGAQEYVLDPRHIAITERGEVRVVAGAPGGDPLVKQIGRILRAMLDGGTAPVPLRLVASQASMELPGFATVGELADALRSFRKSPDSEAIRTAFRRGRDTRFAPPPAPVAPVPRPPSMLGRTIALTPAFSRQEPRFTARFRLPLVVLVSVIIGLALVVVLERPPARRPPAASAAPHAVVAEAPQRSGSSAVQPPRGGEPARPAEPPRTQSLPAPVPHRADAGPARSRPSQSPVVAAAPNVAADNQARPAVPASMGAADAQRLFDRIVLSDPLYRLSPERATPEAIAALRDSKRVLVPDIARRDLERARQAFEAGAYDRAAADATRVTRMLDDLDPGSAPPGLRDAARQLLARIESALAREDQHIYTEADVGVMPPEALSRQLPVTPPTGVSKGQIGTLEMLISRAGQVEAIKLHTPLNRYHERMIVSAAKAWRYKPALKDGKPVRYRLISSINLPES